MKAWTDLKEKDVAKQVTDYLEYRGWRRVRMNSGMSTNMMTGGIVRFGEKGMADLLFLRYFPKQQPYALVLWVETKAPKGKLRPEQTLWQTGERARGGLCVTVYHFETFALWYDETLGAIHVSGDADIPGNMHLF